MSAVRLAKAALPHLKQSGRGRIVHITSISVRQPIANLVLSNAFRSAVTAMAKTLSNEAAPFGVTVNNIAPGTILTDRVRQLHGADLDELGKNVPVGRIGRPEELGATCAFLCSVHAGYITGQSIGIDGGALRGVY
jgi:3-oxoacyl-[acyl-carrier protein] reductase